MYFNQSKTLRNGNAFITTHIALSRKRTQFIKKRILKIFLGNFNQSNSLVV